MGGDVDRLIGEGQALPASNVDAARAAIDPLNPAALLPSSSGTTGPLNCVELMHGNIATNIM